MKWLKTQRLPLALGVVVGVLALWAGAEPVFSSGDSVFGGHEYRWYTVYRNGGIVGCTRESSCYYCEQTKWDNCQYAYDSGWGKLNCGGGSILIAVPDFEYMGTHPNGDAGCYGGHQICDQLQHALCQL